MSNFLKRRLLQSAGATSLGPILTAFIQIVSVPIFLHFWGAKLYGEWLVLSALPVYFGLTDFGIGSVAGNEMTMLVAKGEKDSAIEVFQSTWLLTTCLSLAFSSILAVGIWLLPAEKWLKLAILSRGQVIAILSVLCVYVLLDMQWTVMAAGFRCDGNYALGTIVGSLVRLGANVSAIIAVSLHAPPVAIALSLVIFRLLGNRIGLSLLRRKSPWLQYGYRHATFKAVQKLFRPGIAYLAIPAGNAFILQGMTVVIGLVLGSVAVVTFSTLRTLTRFVYQISDLITNSVWPELSVAFGAEDKLLARNLHRAACQATMAACGAGALFLAVTGRWIYGVWTHNRLTYDQQLFFLLLVEVLANVLWYTSSVVPISCNRHERQSLIYVLSTAASLSIAFFLMQWTGLIGAAISLLLVDLFMNVYVLTNSLSILHDNIFAFSRAMLRPPSLRSQSAERAIF